MRDQGVIEDTRVYSSEISKRTGATDGARESTLDAHLTPPRGEHGEDGDAEPCEDDRVGEHASDVLIGAVLDNEADAEGLGG